MSAMTDRARETAADKRLYVEIGLVPVQCARCGVEVNVKKNSAKHTSVQWTAAAMRGCTQYATTFGCPRLRDSIEAAVRDGRLPVPDE
jgi:hypothetical protein